MWTLLFTFLKSKAGACAIALALLAAIGWFAYDWSYQRGARHQESVDSIKLTAQANAIAGLQNEKLSWIAAASKANSEALAKQQSIKQELQTKIDSANKQAAVLKRQLSEVKKYVTPKADSQCVIPNGFVQLYNQSVSPSTDSNVPGSTPGDAPTTSAAADATAQDANSGLALSAVSTILIANSAECVARGVEIERWQEYYTKNKTAWDAQSHQ